MPEGITIDVLIGLLMPGLVALVNQSHWSPRARGVVAVIVSVAGAAVVEWVRSGPFDLTDWRDTAVVIVFAAITFYKVWWKPSGIGPMVEAATTIGAPRAIARNPEG